MDVSLLIDAVVRQTMVLIANLVRATDHRPQLERIAQQVFLELNDELRRQGVRASLLAGLFGMKLRTYHDRVRRARESVTCAGQPLFQAVFEYIRTTGPAPQWQIEGAFIDDHQKVLQAILDDLVETGLVFKSGRGASTRYGAMPTTAEIPRAPEADATLAHVALYHRSPATREELAEQLGPYVDLDAVLDRLVADGRAERSIDPDGIERFRSDGYLIPVGDPVGWEAAVFDHYQAVVNAISVKLDAGATRARDGDSAGGSTYAFHVPDGHPLTNEVLGLLTEFRTRLTTLRNRVDAVTATEGLDRAESRQVTFYFGQHTR